MEIRLTAERYLFGFPVNAEGWISQQVVKGLPCEVVLQQRIAKFYVLALLTLDQ